MKLYWKSGLRRTDTRRPDVVTSVHDQAEQAAALAQIAGQDRLTDPRTNPAVRALVDQLRNEQHRLLLEAEHGRARRRHRVADRHAADAELTLQAILQAKQASSPARSVLALHRGRTWFMGGSLAASVALSVGSAFGVGHLADELGAPKVTGWVAEVGMVGLSTIVILYLAHLFRHGWHPSTSHRVLLGSLAIGPLLASVVANAFGAGPVGVACSVGAALFGVFSHLVSDNSAGALRKKAAEVGGRDEAALRVAALGGDVFSAPATEPRSGVHETTERTAAEPTTPQVHEPVHEPLRICGRFMNLPQVPNRTTPRTTNHEVREPNTTNHEPAEPVNRTVREPARKPTARTTNRAGSGTGTANLTDRAARKEAEVQQVLNLIENRGVKAITLGVVREELGFTKTTAYNRLTEARERFANQNDAVAS